MFKNGINVPPRKKDVIIQVTAICGCKFRADDIGKTVNSEVILAVIKHSQDTGHTVEFHGQVIPVIHGQVSPVK